MKGKKGKSVSQKLIERMPPNLKLRVFERDSNKCAKCRTQKWLEVHHIVPLYLGGTNDESNLITLCSLCHHFAPDQPLKFVKYMSDPTRPPFDFALDIAEKAFVSAVMLDKEDLEIAKENPVSFWRSRYRKDIGNALTWLYDNE